MQSRSADSETQKTAQKYLWMQNAAPSWKSMDLLMGQIWAICLWANGFEPFFAAWSEQQFQAAMLKSPASWAYV